MHSKPRIAGMGLNLLLKLEFITSGGVCVRVCVRACVRSRARLKRPWVVLANTFPEAFL